MNSHQIIDHHHDLQILLSQRIDSLQLQLNSIPNNQIQTQMIQKFINSHRQFRTVNSNHLVNRQSQIIARQQKQKQLQRYQNKIKQQLSLLDRKEQSIWELTLEGRRIKNIALHKQSINLFQFQEKKIKVVMEQLKTRNKLLHDINFLSNNNQQEQQQQDQTPFFDLRGIDTKVLACIHYQEQRYQQLKQIEQSLMEQLAAVSAVHNQLTDKYHQRLSRKEIPISNDSIQPQSSKTVSTDGDQHSL